MTKRPSSLLIGLTTALVLTGGTVAAIAQQGAGGPRGGPGGGPGGRHGGPGGPLCHMQDSMVPRITGRLDKTLRPTEAQKADFEALTQALTKAEATLKASCPTEAEAANQSPPARLALAEKRMTAGLEALRTVRPAVDTLYAKLDDKQRDALRWMPRGPMFAGMMMGGEGRRGEGRGPDGDEGRGGPRHRDAPRP